MPANKSSVSKTNSLEKMGEFWDKHDLTDFDDPNAPDIEFNITVAIPIEPDLLSDIEELAHQRGVKVETLVNLWLKEKVVETKAG
ncbi:MAG: BrnA antitoxin family protein [Anaerolineae bacterium]|nr:BrnA antitoxin family protein [Anaerolineae bacterium]